MILQIRASLVGTDLTQLARRVLRTGHSDKGRRLASGLSAAPEA